MRDVFDLAPQKGSDPVVNSDMTVELQSLSTQLYHMLVMMLGAEVWRWLLWEYAPRTSKKKQEKRKCKDTQVKKKK